MPYDVEDLELASLWRLDIEERGSQSVSIPRPIQGIPREELWDWPNEYLAFDEITISREAFDRMNDRELLEYIESQRSAIN